MKTSSALASSFRDPSGFVARVDGRVVRQINRVYESDYEMLMSSGLYAALVEEGHLVAHEEVPAGPDASKDCYKLIEPDVIPFIAYPYEWCFSQLRAAALLTLEIQNRAMDFGMSLKDASSFNIQFRGTRAVLIDTLSFERLAEGEPWTAYRQFCQHFLAPLTLMSHRDTRLNALLKSHIDGIPLDLTTSLLPRRARFKPGIMMHIVAHARAQTKLAKSNRRRGNFSAKALRGLIQSLHSAVSGMKIPRVSSAWSSYYDEAGSYSEEGFESKRKLVATLLQNIDGGIVWDLGANTGEFSKMIAERAELVVAFDSDHASVEAHLADLIQTGEQRVLPLIIDLVNPTPALGWQNSERLSLEQRGPADAVVALALVHHLAIGNNVPLQSLAQWLSRLAPVVIIEFVPKQDPRVQTLLSVREDIFTEYTQDSFEKAFATEFTMEKREQIEGSDRNLYLFLKR